MRTQPSIGLAAGEVRAVRSGRCFACGRTPTSRSRSDSFCAHRRTAGPSSPCSCIRDFGRTRCWPSSGPISTRAARGPRRGEFGDEVADLPKTPNGWAVALTDEHGPRRAQQDLRAGSLRPCAVDLPVSRGTRPRRPAGLLGVARRGQGAGITSASPPAGCGAWIDAARRVALDPVLVGRVGHADEHARVVLTVGLTIAAAGASVVCLIRGESGTKSGISNDTAPPR